MEAAIQALSDAILPHLLHLCSLAGEGRLPAAFKQRFKDEEAVHLCFSISRVTSQPRGSRGFPYLNLISHNGAKVHKSLSAYRAHAFSPPWSESAELTQLQAAAVKFVHFFDRNFAVNNEYNIQFCSASDWCLPYHTDRFDVTYQYGISFGQFTGGRLSYFKHGPEGERTSTTASVSTRNRLFRFDGRLPHSVEQFNGLRHSVIYFKHYSSTQLPDQPVPYVYEPVAIEKRVGGQLKKVASFWKNLEWYVKKEKKEKKKKEKEKESE